MPILPFSHLFIPITTIIEAHKPLVAYLSAFPQSMDTKGGEWQGWWWWWDELGDWD